MKTIPLRETLQVVDESAELYFSTTSNRPSETEADLIAAANPVGQVHVGWMFTPKPDASEHCIGRERLKGSCDCYDNPDWWAGVKIDQFHELREHGVNWDPTLRL